MKKLALAAVLAAFATPTLAGSMDAPVMEPEVVVEEAAGSSAGGIVVPLLLLLIVAAVAD